MESRTVTGKGGTMQRDILAQRIIVKAYTIQTIRLAHLWCHNPSISSEPFDDQRDIVSVECNGESRNWLLDNGYELYDLEGNLLIRNPAAVSYAV